MAPDGWCLAVVSPHVVFSRHFVATHPSHPVGVLVVLVMSVKKTI